MNQRKNEQNPPLTKEELESKKKKWAKISTVAIRTTYASVAISLGGNVLGYLDSLLDRDNPEIIEKYEQKNESVEDFRRIQSGNYYFRGHNFNFFEVDNIEEDSYLQERLQNIENICSEESQLAINHLEKQLSEIESSNEFEEVRVNPDRMNFIYSIAGFGGIFLSFGGLGATLFSSHKWNKYRLQEKHNK